MTEAINFIAALFFLGLGITMIVAALRIFRIDATLLEQKKLLAKILKAIETADQNRRDEFNALAQEQQ